MVDNAFMDFDEPPNESIQGWKGITVVANYEVAKIPLSFEYTRLGYNYNGSRAADSALSNFFRLDNDRKTTILVARAGYVVPVAGGIELGAKYKLVDDKNTFSAATAADDLQTKDSGYTLSVGNQLFRDLYGQISYGQYSRKFTLTNTDDVDNKKNILSVKLAYNLAGFETGLLAQWVRGDVSLNSGAAALTAHGSNVCPHRFFSRKLPGQYEQLAGVWKICVFAQAGRRDQLPDNVKQAVHRIADNITNPKEKIAKLYEYVQKNNRYISIQLGIGGCQPFGAKYVATKAYGDCKPLTNYMYSILKEDGHQLFLYFGKGGKKCQQSDCRFSVATVQPCYSFRAAAKRYTVAGMHQPDHARRLPGRFYLRPLCTDGG